MLWVWLLCGLLAGHTAHASGPVVLRDNAPEQAVWPAVTVLLDESRQWKLADILGKSDQFRPTPYAGSLGMRQEAVWLRIPLEVTSESDGRWVLDIDHPELQSIQVFLTQEGEVVQTVHLGSALPFHERPVASRSHTMQLLMQPQHQYDLYLRIETTSAVILPITLMKPRTMLEHSVNEQMLQGLLTGLALCLIVYSLSQWVSLREPMFWQYALMTTGSLLYSLHHFGVGRQYLWTHNLWMTEHVAGLASMLATAGSFLFVSQAMFAQRPHSRMLRLMRAGAVLCGLLAVAYALDIINTRIVVAVMSVLCLTPVLLGIPGAMRRMLDKDAIATCLLAAWSVYFLATATIVGVINGWVPVNFWTQHSFQFGATIDMIVFMRVLGLRSKAVYLQALAPRQEAPGPVPLVQTDPLTGLPNRRGLSAALAAALPRCAPERLLAVYMLDLDGFKAVNDLFGHDRGDELLIAVAQRLQGLIGEGDIVARLGGDEFVVVAGQLTHTEQAQTVGKQLLQAFHTPFQIQGTQVKVGATIGYAIAPNDSNDGTGLLKLADAAMYSGKHTGKFCLRRNQGELALSSI